MTIATKPSPVNKSGIEPCGNRILVKPDELEEVTEGGIVLPESVKNRHEDAAGYGYVIAVGSDAYTHSVSTTKRHIDGTFRMAEQTSLGYSSPWVKPGDRVAFRPYVGLNSTGEDGVKYLLFNDEDIIAKVTDKVTQTTIEARKPLSQK
jgi:co-chaperonin GroES (HSP10)